MNQISLPILTTTLLIGLSARAADHFAARHIAQHPALTLEGARQAAAAAETFARHNGATPSIAVVDEAGTLLHFVRLDGNFPAAANVAIGKARTAAIFRKPTREFEELINKGRFTMTALLDFTPLQGGVPIVLDGRVVGAIGVSGAASAAQDDEVARAGAGTLASVPATATAK